MSSNNSIKLSVGWFCPVCQTIVSPFLQVCPAQHTLKSESSANTNANTHKEEEE